jgi:hypothetical protein
MSPENTLTSPISQKRIEANRRNAQKSTGPKTPEGKGRSRFNGLTHGLTAKTAVLPGEDPTEYQARADAVVESLAPRSQVELELAHRVATTAWSLDRATRAETAQISHRILHHAIERRQCEREEAIALGQRLLWDARGPWQLYPHHPTSGLNWERQTSWSENPADPNNPALLVHRLERIVAGCQWLMDRWAELRARLEPGEVWTAPDQFKAVRLLGRQPVDAVDSPEVAQIFLAGAKLLGNGNGNRKGTGPDAFAAVKSEVHQGGLDDGTDDYGIYSTELAKRPHSKLSPPDAEAARGMLRFLVDRHLARLKLIQARNAEVAEADAALAPDRLAFDPGPDGEKLRRYVLSASRLLNQTLKTYLSVARGPAAGGSGVREESAGEVECLESSVVRCPSSVVEGGPDRWPETGAEIMAGGYAPEVVEAQAPFLRTEANGEESSESSVAPCPSSVVAGAPDRGTSTGAEVMAGGCAPEVIEAEALFLQTEANGEESSESSVARCQSSVVAGGPDRETVTGAEGMPEGHAREATAAQGPFLRTEANGDESSVARCPSSAVAEGPDRRVATGAEAAAGGHAPEVVEAEAPFLRTEPNFDESSAAGCLSSAVPRLCPTIEASPPFREASDKRKRRTTDSERSELALLGQLRAELHKEFLALVTPRRPKAATENQSRKKQARARSRTHAAKASAT